MLVVVLSYYSPLPMFRRFAIPVFIGILLIAAVMLQSTMKFSSANLTGGKESPVTVGGALEPFGVLKAWAPDVAWSPIASDVYDASVRLPGSDNIAANDRDIPAKTLRSLVMRVDVPSSADAWRRLGDPQTIRTAFESAGWKSAPSLDVQKQTYRRIGMRSETTAGTSYILYEVAGNTCTMLPAVRCESWSVSAWLTSATR